MLTAVNGGRKCKKRRPLTEAERQTLLAWLPMIYRQSKRFRWASKHDSEDAEQEAALTAVVALTTHIPDKSLPQTHMGAAASLHMLTHAKRVARRGMSGKHHNTYAETAAAIPASVHIDAVPFQSQPVEMPSAAPDVMDELQRVLAVLPEREYSVVVYRWLGGLKLAEVGQILGITRERVRQIEGDAFARIRDAFQTEE